MFPDSRIRQKRVRRCGLLIFIRKYFTLQSLNTAYWIAAALGAGFVGFAHCHTDEIPVVFGFVIVVGAVLGGIAPRRAVLSWAIVGAPVPIVEMLVRYSLLQAPWPPSANPLVGFVAYVPAAIGVAAGAAMARGFRDATKPKSRPVS
jgi:hypothetical protein